MRVTDIVIHERLTTLLSFASKTFFSPSKIIYNIVLAKCYFIQKISHFKVRALVHANASDCCSDRKRTNVNVGDHIQRHTYKHTNTRADIIRLDE